MNMRTSRKSGFTLVEIMIVVGIIGLTAVIGVPSYVRANSNSQKNACINNLYQIRCAIHQWALETKAPSGTPVQFTDIHVYLRNTLTCPAGGTNFRSEQLVPDSMRHPPVGAGNESAQRHACPIH